MGKRHTRIIRAVQRRESQGSCDRRGPTLLVGLLLFAWLAATPTAPTVAATGGGASSTTSAVETEPEYWRAAVTLDGNVLFYVRGIPSYPATRRAREISENIRQIAADLSISPDSLSVIETRLLVTRPRTVKNEEIIVPNSLILNSHVMNYSTLAQSSGLILHTTVGIGYETSWRQVEGMLRVAAERTPGLLKEPPPFVLQKTLGDFAVTYEINVYCDNPQAMARRDTAQPTKMCRCL